MECDSRRNIQIQIHSRPEAPIQGYHMLTDNLSYSDQHLPWWFLPLMVYVTQPS